MSYFTFLVFVCHLLNQVCILHLQNTSIQTSHISSVAIVMAKINKPVTSGYGFEQCNFNACENVYFQFRTMLFL